MDRERIAVALSGGVDSAYSAYLLKKEGKELVGVTFKLSFFKEENIRKAQYVCNFLGIPHHLIDVNQEFKNIIDYFVSSYLDGLTPNPCALCNQIIKFGKLLDYIRMLGCCYLATGHYCRLIKTEKGEIYLAKGRSMFNSQEYFLALTPKEKFNSVIFPLGDYTKEEVKRNIQKEGFYPFPIEESKEVCFIGNSTYKDFIRKRILRDGDYSGQIKHHNGKVLGTHQGVYFFTYGQREGLGVSWKKPLYVMDILPSKREVIVGEREFILKERFFVNHINWFYPPSNYRNLRVKLRYNSYSLPCDIEISSHNRILCILKDKREVPAPGQLAVFYDRDLVVAGGLIEKESAS
ncbi:MAG: tRNA 2-thiouridine(34) synthase MnmA [Candidatus Omnitrophota bacterium]|nr:MAG: tRNA 2-thiouridine(34) synthase MnmA [Candidatus Omnitrophota bacterium]